MQPFQYAWRGLRTQPWQYNYAHTSKPLVAEHRRNRFDDETSAAATAARMRYLSSPAAATLRGKTHVLRLPPQNKPHAMHATFMQPLQCVLQHHVANAHLFLHMATKRDTNHAAIPLRSAASKTPFNYAHTNNHSLQNTEEESIRRWNERSSTCRTHEVPCIAGCSHVTQKNTRFRAPASSPKESPCKIHAAITIRFAAPPTHSRSHYNAFCSFTWLTRIFLCTWPQNMATMMQPLHCDLQREIQQAHRTTHTWTTTKCRTQRRNRLRSKRSKPQPLHTRGTFHRRLQPLYTEKRKVSCSGFLPKTYNAFAASRSKSAWHCDLQPEIHEAHRTTHAWTINSHSLQNTGEDQFAYCCGM